MVVIATQISGSKVRRMTSDARGMLGKGHADDEDVKNVFQSLLQLAC